MPAHDSLEHCAVMGYLCQPNGSKIPARRWGRAGCTQACLRDRSPTARRARANSIQPPGREDVVLIISGLQVLKGRLGRFVTKGVCRSRDGWSWVPALSPVHRLGLLGTDLGEDFYFSDTGEEKKPNTFQLALRELLLPTNAMLICLKGIVRISRVRNPYCQLKFNIVPKRHKRR